MTQNIFARQMEEVLSSVKHIDSEIEPRDMFPVINGYLFNAVIEYSNPRGTFREVCNVVPEEYADALRRVLRMRQLARDRPESFNVSDAFLTPFRIPPFAEPQDRLDAAWSAVVGFTNREFLSDRCGYWFPWAANDQDRRMLDYFNMRVVDAESATVDEQLDKLIRYAVSAQRQDVATSVSVRWVNAVRAAADDEDVPLSVGRQLHERRFSGLAPC